MAIPLSFDDTCLTYDDNIYDITYESNNCIYLSYIGQYFNGYNITYNNTCI
jgi:hypothetical protein